MVPVMGYVCRICHKFYHGSSGAKLSHCKSVAHLENLQVSWACSPTPPRPGLPPSQLGVTASGHLPPVFDLSSQTHTPTGRTCAQREEEPGRAGLFLPLFWGGRC